MFLESLKKIVLYKVNDVLLKQRVRKLKPRKNNGKFVLVL